MLSSQLSHQQLCCQFLHSNKLNSMFFHMDSIKKFKSSIQSWRFATIIIIIISVRGVGDNKDEKLLLIANGEGELDRDVLTFGNNFKT